MKKLLLLFIFLFSTLTLQAQEAPPLWVQKHWQFLTQDNGIWIADNSEYKNENEPYEAYGIKWEWGFAKKSIKGRLYGIKDGEDIGTFWEFHSVWHPGEKAVKEHQFGSDGTLGVGWLRQIGPDKVEQEMQFFAPDGSTYKRGHREEVKDVERHSRSFVITESGEWKERRFYVWKPGQSKTQ